MATGRTQEQNLRKKAKRQGYLLRSSRRRDPNALDYGQWRIETQRGRVVLRGDLDQVAAWLRTPRGER